MTDKTDDHALATVVARSGKVYKLKAVELSDIDQEYILEWSPRVDHLTCRVVKSGKGLKTIRIKVIATNSAITLEVSPDEGGFAHPPVEVPKDTEVTLDFVCKSRYVATVTNEDGETLDQESWNRKTGL